jgi:hypothetical protein
MLSVPVLLNNTCSAESSRISVIMMIMASTSTSGRAISQSILCSSFRANATIAWCSWERLVGILAYASGRSAVVTFMVLLDSISTTESGIATLVASVVLAFLAVELIFFFFGIFLVLVTMEKPKSITALLFLFLGLTLSFFLFVFVFALLLFLSSSQVLIALVVLIYFIDSYTYDASSRGIMPVMVIFGMIAIEGGISLICEVRGLWS